MKISEERYRGSWKWQEDEEEDVGSYWMSHILRRICLLKQVIEGKIKGEMDVARRRGRRRKRLLDDLKDTRGYSHLK